MVFSTREVATLLAALQFWREEITPHAPEIAVPYLEEVGFPAEEPLSEPEIEALAQRLRNLPPSD